MDFTQTTQQYLSLCYGGGGLDRGLQRAFKRLGWTKPNPAAYVEIGAFENFNLVKQIEKGVVDWGPIWTDCKTFPYASFHNKLHGIIGGYPCQPFSHAGKRKGTTDPRHLWPFIQAGIKSVKPVWCFFENVEGHLSLGFDQVYKDLVELGYNVEAGLYSAEEVGATHQRKRLFILGFDNSYSCKQNSKGIYIEKNCVATEEKCRAKHGSVIPGRTGYNESKEMANTNRVGSDESIKKSKPKFTCKNEFKWPSGPGEKQHDWEYRRTIKPGMGCTIDGYNFRNDLLRMYGNGVVEQTAEIAFIDLLKKHMK